VPFILPNQERIERRGEKERRKIESDKVGRRWRMSLKKQEEREANEKMRAQSYLRKLQ
jgi:hypothetical protein